MKEFINHCKTLLLDQYPELRNMVESIIENNPDYYEIAAHPARIIKQLCPSDEKLQEALKGYIRFCDTFKQKQIEFTRNDSYIHDDFDKVNEEVYQNREYMLQTYYPALLFSYLFSSNYFEILRVFKTNFLPTISKVEGNMCEIGIGHGMLSSLALIENAHLQSFGIDISPVADEVTSSVSNILNCARPSVTLADATQNIPFKNNNVLICAEVLEHLSNPLELLNRAYDALNEDGIFFLTASINMESVDHLYLFRSDEEVIQMIDNVGFEIVERHLAFLTTQSYLKDQAIISKLMKRNNPSTSILILKKATNTIQ
jgi:2-polyprenyl-3-methyl-5-hydroxy-6-metoxy-1,4-benzoquinol methylase